MIFECTGKGSLSLRGAAATSRTAHQRQLPARVRSGENGHGAPRVLQGKGAGQRHRPRAAPRSAPGPGGTGRLPDCLRRSRRIRPLAARPARRWSRIPCDLRGRKMLAGSAAPADQLAHPASVGERARSTFRARKAIRQPKRAACVSAGRRAIIQRASCRWQLCHSPNARSARLHVYAVLPSDERPVMPRTGRITALKLGGLAGP